MSSGSSQILLWIWFSNNKEYLYQTISWLDRVLYYSEKGKILVRSWEEKGKFFLVKDPCHSYAVMHHRQFSQIWKAQAEGSLNIKNIWWWQWYCCRCLLLFKWLHVELTRVRVSVCLYERQRFLREEFWSCISVQLDSQIRFLLLKAIWSFVIFDAIYQVTSF